MNILLTGANGYIGKRLLPALIEKGHRVYCVVRDPARLNIEKALLDKIQVVVCDLNDPDSYANLPGDIEVAYYLVHSMTQSSRDFHQLELETARTFAGWIRQTAARQIIYLGGIVNDSGLSKHLRSRQAVGETLRESGVPVTVLQAAIIIGSGSASFEIIRDLVEKLPVMIAPRWLNTRCQPIAVRDVIRYLVSVIGHPGARNRTFDIGGPDILTYKEMLLKFAEVRGYTRYIISVPVLTPRLSSYWLYFVTSTSFNLARSLVDSMKNEVVCQNHDIREIDSHSCLSYTEAIEVAFSKIEENVIISSWKDALSSKSLSPEFSAYIQIPQFGCLTDQREVALRAPVSQVLRNIWEIGGNRGWYYLNWLWGIRGFVDKLFGGVGLRRGRRDPRNLQTGDSLDFWRVILADKKNKRLLLYAEMKLPGEAWLEFNISEDKNPPRLQQTATFRPRGVLGRLYWYGVYPLHVLVFRGMAQRIASVTPEDQPSSQVSSDRY